MPDTEQSGAPSTAPADSAAAAPSAPAAGVTPSIGAFGSTRGSGLLRGKRPTVAAPSAASSAPAGYKPTALEVITPVREYRNPFTGETTVSAPVVNEPAPQAAPSLPSEASAKEGASVVPAAIAKESAPAPAAELFPFHPPASPAAARATAPEERPELKILPPEEAKRPALSWESTKPGAAGEPRREDRGSFRPERREPRPFEPREPRRDERKFEPRTNQPYQPREERGPRPEAAAPEKKSGGFIGWLKGLFGGKKPAEAPRPENREGGRDGEYGHRRHHRGGRGRGRGGFDRGGPRDPRQQPRDPRDEGGQPYQGGEHHGEQRGEGGYGDGGRRRRRGGRGRFRGEGDGGGRDPRPEGQQGGGAI